MDVDDSDEAKRSSCKNSACCLSRSVDEESAMNALVKLHLGFDKQQGATCGGSNIDSGSNSISKTQEMLEVLVHSSQCRHETGQCTQDCEMMKALISHVMYACNGECQICRRFFILLAHHTNVCTLDFGRCPVLKCSETRFFPEQKRAAELLLLRSVSSPQITNSRRINIAGKDNSNSQEQQEQHHHLTNVSTPERNKTKMASSSSCSSSLRKQTLLRRMGSSDSSYNFGSEEKKGDDTTPQQPRSPFQFAARKVLESSTLMNSSPLL
jgi:hypothetical protein